ncbi:MAG: 23S rRNA (adenine(2503)-C(2))-methyltransferase RlmN [Pseudomonadota bacterium]
MSSLPLRSLRLPDLERLMEELKEPQYRAKQIFSWIHQHGVTSTEHMTNISKNLRARLAESVEFSPLVLDETLESEDGTRKFRFLCSDNSAIESVLIPARNKQTLCVSTQVGCALGCRFCATAQMGMKRNLNPGEIVDQVYRVRSMLLENQRISNLVFMGMGEPMANLDNVLTAVEILCQDIGANFSPRKITISTAGMVPGIVKMGELAPRVGLARSLHATTDAVRTRVMPITHRGPIQQWIDALRQYPLPKRRRITIEYVLIAGLNDTLADAKRLPALLNKIPVKINLLAYNPCRIDQPDFERPSDESVEAFAERLRIKGLHTTVRQSRGTDIAAACGQLVIGTN